MKKILVIFVAMLMMAGMAMAAKPVKDTCVTIQDGTLLTSDSTLIPMGFITEGPKAGYNYQAHLFNGLYDADNLVMKWSDEWLSNKDCNLDGKLDRGYSCNPENASSSACPGAWVTNHFTGNYQGENYNWDVSGTWLLDFAGGTDNREFLNLVQDAEGNVVGEFWYLSGSDWLYGGTLVGTVIGDNLHLDYDRAPIVYTGVFDGTIGDNVITDGTFSDSHGNNLLWTATGTSEKVYEICYWNEFIKIVAAPADAYKVPKDANGRSILGVWYTADNVEIGSVIWGAYAIIQDIWNDPCAGLSGVYYNSDAPKGFGFYKP